MKSLKYAGHAIVMQEVPDEITLAFNISGCKHHCPGCHSEYLWEDVGNNLLDDLKGHLDTYGHLITCVCFMGGEQNPKELLTALLWVKMRGLKTCLYTGCDDVNEFTELLPWLDYLKVGHFDINLGGLDKPTTNQHMYYMNDGYITDITSTFWEKR